MFLVGQVSGLIIINFRIWIFSDTLNVINVKLFMMAPLSIEFYLFIPLSLTWTIFQGHSNVNNNNNNNNG